MDTSCVGSILFLARATASCRFLPRSSRWRCLFTFDLSSASFSSLFCRLWFALLSSIYLRTSLELWPISRTAIFFTASITWHNRNPYCDRSGDQKHSTFVNFYRNINLIPVCFAVYFTQMKPIITIIGYFICRALDTFRINIIILKKKLFHII